MIKVSTLARGAAALALAAGVTLAGAGASADAQNRYQGEVTGSQGVTVRSGPSANVSTKGRAIPKGAKIGIECKVVGPSVSGNRNWYSLGGNRWVSARYVRNIGAAPKPCPEFDTDRGVGRTKTALQVRTGPSTRDARVRTLPQGTQFEVRCFAYGENVGGWVTWYQLSDSSGWVAARHVDRLPAEVSNWAPCSE